MKPENAKLQFVAWVRASSLLWVPAVGLTWAAMAFWGTPHLRISYSWNGRDAAPFYYACNYWAAGAFSVRPANGKCPLIVLAHPAPVR